MLLLIYTDIVLALRKVRNFCRYEVEQNGIEILHNYKARS